MVNRRTSSFDAVFTAEGTRIVVSPPQAPGANAICERFIGTLRRELPGRLLIVKEQRPRPAHPAQAGTCPPGPVNLAEHRIRRKQVLGGLTHEYYVAA